MNTNYGDYKTPGQLIEAFLNDRGWSQRTLGVVLDISESAVHRFVSNRQPVSAALALQLEDVLGVSADKLLSLQKSYDLAKARIEARPDPGRSTRALLFGDLPIKEMIKRRWLEAEDIRNVSGVEGSLAKFFGVSSPEEIEILPHAAKKTQVIGEVTPSQLAWLYRVKQIAGGMIVHPYSPRAVQRAMPDLSALLSAPEEARKVPRILAECGIRFAIVESLSSAKIDGVCFWLDETSPVIGMSLRYDRIDNFWFVLRHELEHVLRLHGRTSIYLDVELEGERAGTGADIIEEERQANEAAAAFCVPQERLNSFIARKSPFFSEQDIIGFSRLMGIHPGLAAGQLQRRTGRYDLFRWHLAKIRNQVKSSAMVDGWGDVAPVEY